jgi:hypothetical protein
MFKFLNKIQDEDGKIRSVAQTKPAALNISSYWSTAFVILHFCVNVRIILERFQLVPVISCLQSIGHC